MKHHAKTDVQAEQDEKLKGHKPPIQSQKTATPDLANLSQTGLQGMSRDDILTLQRTIGNRAVARLMAQRGGEAGEVIDDPRIHREGDEDELVYPGPRSQNKREDVLEYPGPRTKQLRENGAQQRGGSGRPSR